MHFGFVAGSTPVADYPSQTAVICRRGAKALTFLSTMLEDKTCHTCHVNKIGIYPPNIKWEEAHFSIKFKLLIYFLFPDIKVNMTEQSRQGDLLARSLLKVSMQRYFSYTYQHYVATVVFLNMQQLRKEGSIIQGAIIRSKGKENVVYKLAYEIPMFNKWKMSYMFL